MKNLFKQKGLIYAACGLWLAVMVNHIIEYRQSQNQEEMVVEAFQSIDFVETEVYLELSGNYSEYLEPTNRVDLLTGIGEELGITKGYTMKTYDRGNGSETIYNKVTAEAEVTIKYLSINENRIPDNYLVIQMTLQGNIEYALNYKRLIEDIRGKYKTNGAVCMQMKGTYPKELSLKEKDAEVARLLKQLDASEVSSSKTDSLYTVYGYTPYVADYLYAGEAKTNVNVAFHDSGNATQYYLGIPVIREGL